MAMIGTKLKSQQLDARRIDSEIIQLEKVLMPHINGAQIELGKIQNGNSKVLGLPQLNQLFKSQLLLAIKNS